MIDLGWLARVAASTVVRRLTTLALVALLAYVGIGRANAQQYPDTSYCSSNNESAYCTSEFSANAAAQAAANAHRDAAINGPWGGTPGATVCARVNLAPQEGTVYGTVKSLRYGVANTAACDSFIIFIYRSWVAADACPGGYERDPFNPSQCMDADKCQALNSGLGNSPRTETGSTKCVAGCLMGFPGGTTTVTVPGAVDTLHNGVLRYLGPSCASETPVTTEAVEQVKTPEPQECLARDGSLTSVCVKANGERCHSTSSGFQQCWTPGETGEKTDGPVKQVTNAGPNAVVPPLILTNGDTLEQKNPPVTTTTTKNNSGGTTTITTTTTNYTTVNGTNAGPKGTDTAEKNDGTGSNQPGDGDGKTASGGQNCEPSGAPVVNGDAHLQMVATQAWATRCAVESKDAVTSTGEIADCTSNFTLTGPAKSAELIKLKGLRETICGVDKNLKDGDPNGPGSVDGVGLEGDITDTPFAGIVGEGDAVGADGLNDQGFGFSRACPSMPSVDVFGTTVQFDNSIMCDWLALAGMFVLALAALASVKILAMGGNV